MSGLQPITWFRQHGPSSVVAPLLFAFCAAAHTVTCIAVQAAGSQVTLVNSKTVTRLAIIDFIDTHPWHAFGYLAFVLVCLLRLELRHSPGWLTWSVLVFLGLPFVAYAYGCIRVWIQL
jgi:hypothetical protein